MFKIITEAVSLVLFGLAVLGYFGAPRQVSDKRFSFVGVGIVAGLGLASSRTVVPGHELLTLVGVYVLLFADLVWFAVSFSAAHGISLFGWLQAHKADADKQADLQAATQAAKTALATDASTAKTTATAAAGGATGAAVSGAAGVVAEGVATAVEDKLKTSL